MKSKTSNFLICTLVLINIFIIPSIVLASECKPFNLQPYAQSNNFVSCVKFSPNNNLLARGERGQVTLLNVKTTETVAIIKLKENSYITKIIFTPDNSKLIATDKDDIWIIDLKSFKIIHTLNVNNDYGSYNNLDMVLSNDGKTIYSANYQSYGGKSQLEFYDVETGKELKKLNLGDIPTSIDYNKNNDTIAISLKNGITTIKNAKTGEQVKNIFINNIDKNDYSDYTIEFSPDNKLLFFSKDYWEDNKITILDVNDNYKNITKNNNEFNNKEIQWHKISNNGQLIVINKKIYDINSGIPIAYIGDYDANGYIADFDKDDNILAFGVYLYDLSVIPRKKLNKIKIDANKNILNYDEKINVALIGYYDDGTYEKIKYEDADWSTSDFNVAMVNDGNIIARDQGKAKISVNYKGLKSDLDITVLPKDNTAYKIWETQYNQPLNKTFEVVFTTKIDISTIKEQNIYVTDSQGNIIPMFYYCNQGNENKISIIPIKDYVSKQTYTLWIKNIKATNGKTLRKNVKMDFTIK